MKKTKFNAVRHRSKAREGSTAIVKLRHNKSFSPKQWRELEEVYQALKKSEEKH